MLRLFIVVSVDFLRSLGRYCSLSPFFWWRVSGLYFWVLQCVSHDWITFDSFFFVVVAYVVEFDPWCLYFVLKVFCCYFGFFVVVCLCVTTIP